MTSLLIGKDVKYAADASNTVHTALTPDKLLEGSVGIYGIHDSTTNPNREVLITDGGSEAAGKVPASAFNGDSVRIAVGRPADKDGNPRVFISPLVQVANLPQLLKIYSTKYSAPVKKIIAIGYNGTTGSLNLPAEIKKFDEGQIKFTELNLEITAGGSPFHKQRVSVVALDDTAAYSLLKIAMDDIVARTGQDLKITAQILSSVAGTNFTTSATVAAVKGETSLTTSADHGVGVNDFVKLDGDVYKAVTGTTGSTLVLDRPYQGATATIANASAKDLGTDPGELGLKFTSISNDYNFDLGADGFLSNSTFSTVQEFSAGIGTAGQMKKLEKDVIASMGSADQLTTYMPKPASVVPDAGTYDQYVIRYSRNDQARGSIGSVFDIENDVIIAFPTGVADTSGFNQSNFEDVLGQFYSSFSSLF